MRLKFAISQISRLLSRSPLDVLSFARYFIRTTPARLVDRFPGGKRVRFSTKSRHCFEGELRPLPEELSSYIDDLSEFGRSIVEDGRIFLLGTELGIGWPPKWETRETGVFSKGLSSKIPFYGSGVNGDIKVIWELHRLQWMPAIASYAIKTENEVLIEEVVDSLIEYSVTHPYGRTVSWIEGIEVSIRAISAIMTILTLGDRIGMDKMIRLKHWIGLHGEWLNSHLSRKWRLNNNHLILELIGLSIIGIQMPTHPDSGKWAKRGLSLLKEEVSNQTIDGRNWEPTTAYHRFVTESLLVHYSFSKKYPSIYEGGLGEFEYKLQELVATLAQITDESGRIPLVGDDDGGCVLPLNGAYRARDAERVLFFAEKLGFDINKEKEGRRAWGGLGMGVIWDENKLVHIVSGSPSGVARQASHRHLDMLSVTASINGRDVILDCGTGVYFGSDEFRNWFRSEKAHSGVFSQNLGWGKIRGPFEITRSAIGKIEITESGVQAECVGTKGHTSRREVKIEDGRIVILDQIEIDNPVVNFVMPVGTEVTNTGDSIKLDGPGFSLEHRPIPESLSVSDQEPSQIKSGRTVENMAVLSNGYGTFEGCIIFQLKHKRGVSADTVVWES